MPSMLSVDGSARTYAVDIDHHMDTYTLTYIHTHTHIHTDRHTHRQTHTHTQTYIHTDRHHTHRQTYTHTDTQTLVKKSKSGLIFSGKRSTQLRRSVPPTGGNDSRAPPQGGAPITVILQGVRVLVFIFLKEMVSGVLWFL